MISNVFYVTMPSSNAKKRSGDDFPAALLPPNKKRPETSDEVGILDALAEEEIRDSEELESNFCMFLCLRRQNIYLNVT